jgi:hypothetical protein
LPPFAALADYVAKAGDLVKLDGTFAQYIEWPHVDGRFLALFQTLPGYTPISDR